jgi:quinol monooxygenase YgiN
MIANHGFSTTVTARPGQADELVRLLLDAPSLPAEDCVVFLISRSASNPDLIHVVEGWTSQEAHSRFFASEPARALVASMEPLVADSSPYTDFVPVGGKAAF